jgi:4-amino-4-deoxy-L-arabinose transferase-like glycosyltransferase
MRTLQKELLPYLALLALGSLAFVHLMALPAFEDEGSQLRWVWRLVQARDWRSSLGDGKPLEAWLVAPLALAGFAPLAAARTLHVLSGVLGALLIYRLVRQISDRAPAFVTAVLFIICPFVVYLQRLALSDSFLCTAGIWVLLSTVKLMRSPNWRLASETGMALALAAVCKLPVGCIFVISTPLALLCMPSQERQALLRRPELTKLVAAHVPVLLIALVVVVAAMIQVRRGHAAGFGMADLIGIGLGHYEGIAQNIGVSRSTLHTELATQLTWPVVLLGLVGIAAALFAGWRYRWLVAVGLIPMIAIGWLPDFWYPRYLLFTLPPLIVAAVAGWQMLSALAPRLGRAVEWTVLIVCVVFMGRQSALIVLNPLAASWSAVDRFQYFEGWGSGYGYPEAARYLLRAQDVPQVIFSLDGHSAFQLLAYLPAAWNERVRTIAYGDDGKELRSEQARINNLLEHTPAWIVIPKPLLETYLDSTFGTAGREQMDLRPLASFDKPGGRVQLALYRVSRR